MAMFIQVWREQPWHSGSVLDCRSRGWAIDPAYGARLIPKFLLLLSQGAVSLKLVGGKLALKLVYFVLRKEYKVLKLSEMVPRLLSPAQYSLTMQYLMPKWKHRGLLCYKLWYQFFLLINNLKLVEDKSSFAYFILSVCLSVCQSIC